MDMFWVLSFLAPALLLCALALSAPFWSRRFWPGADASSRALRMVSALTALVAACLSLAAGARIQGFITPFTAGAIDYIGGILLLIGVIAVIVLREHRRGSAQRRI